MFRAHLLLDREFETKISLWDLCSIESALLACWWWSAPLSLIIIRKSKFSKNLMNEENCLECGPGTESNLNYRQIAYEINVILVDWKSLWRSTEIGVCYVWPMLSRIPRCLCSRTSIQPMNGVSLWNRGGWMMNRDHRVEISLLHNVTV